MKRVERVLITAVWLVIFNVIAEAQQIKDLQALRQSYIVCATDSDCTAVYGCCQWYAVNQKSSHPNFSNHAQDYLNPYCAHSECDYSHDFNFLPVAKCIKNECLLTDQMTTVTKEEWLKSYYPKN